MCAKSQLHWGRLEELYCLLRSVPGVRLQALQCVFLTFLSVGSFANVLLLAQMLKWE